MDRVKRFKTPAYRQRINTARSYKRPRLPDPERAQKIKSWILSILSVLVLSLIVYLVYFASFLKITTLQIDGASTELSERIQNDFASVLKSYKNGLPERNFLLFSTADFSSIVANDPEVSSVQFDRRHPWHKIEISVVQRVPRYVLKKWPDTYLLADDGATSALLPAEASFSPTLPIITDQNINDNFKLGSFALPKQEMAFIEYIRVNLKNYVSLSAVSYSINSSDSQYFTVNTDKGVNLMFDYSTDVKEYLRRLQVIWQQFSPQAQNQLIYVDLRFDANSYTCMKNQPCAQGVVNSAVTSSSNIAPTANTQSISSKVK